jgi:2-polyprenyl-3-methyl-5-hydroxy-6-metoxy-1,4-benzoquinol methylase
MRQLYNTTSEKTGTSTVRIPYEEWNGIHISPETRKHFAEFEAQYAHLRAQEQRVFTPEEIRQLPVTREDHPHHEEWEMRRHTISAFLDYLKNKGTGMQILDIGCGNGFFSHLMTEAGNRVIGVDVSLFELEQAAHCFGSSNPSWYYADVMRDQLPVALFDAITLCASLTYFPDAASLLNRCNELLKPGGEIHILETPIYRDEKAAAKARENSARHFQSKEAAGMMMFYHFHTWDVFKGLDYSINSRMTSFFNKMLRLRRSPFSWIIVKKR